MMIYCKPDSPSIYDIEVLLLVQEARLEKFSQELAVSNVFVNVAQTSQNQNLGFSHNDASSSGNFHNNSRGRDWGGRGRGDNYPTFQLCHKYGHDAFSCWHRLDQGFIPLQPPKQVNQGNGNGQFNNSGNQPQYRPNIAQCLA